MDLRNAIYEHNIPVTQNALQNGANPHHAILYAARTKKASIITILYNHGARLNASELLLVKNVPLIANLLELGNLDMQELDNAFFEYTENLRANHEKLDYTFCNAIQKLISYPRRTKAKDLLQ